MSKPVLLDGFCKAGGATKGYQMAGFHVVGVDIEPQPHYCGDEFIQADFFDFPLEGYDAIHVSPPCQRFSSMTRVNQGRADKPHKDLIGPARARLVASGVPCVIENVEGAPLVNPVMLCGSMFDPPLDVRRHRLFESNWGLRQTDWPCRHKLWSKRYPSPWSRLDHGEVLRVVSVYGGSRFAGDGPLRKQAMEINWMTLEELNQAIPPRYTEFIGEQLLAALAVTP